ncbi:MAG: tRNA uridine-5-carboxymethylaminomethyl(34) synthesis GTPase MnmE [Dokdonella sp.]
MSAPHETIVALATAPAASGVGIVRVSGMLAGTIAREFLGTEPTPRHAHFCAFPDRAGTAIDRGLLLWFAAPHSYTGEDVLELHAHGSPIVLRRLVDRTVELGARAARPGEFSERAFLNGKLDLIQAEAIADLIASGSEVAARAALRSLEGEFSAQVKSLTEAVVRVRTWIEAAIDFPEEEIDFLATPQLHADLADLVERANALLAAARVGVRLNDNLHVVIVGRPNAGKSSVLNALARSDRAIVTEVPGTTRDPLRETIELDGVALTLIDTAGLHDSVERIEQEGMRRARCELARADLALLISDDKQAEADLALLADLPANAARMVVHNKIDLSDNQARRVEIGGRVDLWLSAKTGNGVNLLRTELRKLAAGEEAADGAFSARARHVEAIERARDHVVAARDALKDQAAGELAAADLRQAQQALGEVTGEFTSDDLLGRIFSSFCIGK